VRDAIVQFREVGGRAYFTNAGRTKSDGIELGLTVRPLPQVTLLGAYTFTDARFVEYRIHNGATIDTLDGRRQPGVPRHVTRLGIRFSPLARLTFAADQFLTSSMWADDRNTLPVDNWGLGVTNLRLGWEGSFGRLAATPFLSVENLTGRRYVPSVTVNGAGGRVLEPAPGRLVYAGAEVELGGGTRNQ
jgi:iron complex outermembrane receptor protein